MSILFHIGRFFFFLMLPPPPRSTLFPYTTLFRSQPLYTLAVSLSQTGLTTETQTETFGIRTVTTSLIGADRKSTRLNSSHVEISYAVFCLKKKTEKT